MPDISSTDLWVTQKLTTFAAKKPEANMQDFLQETQSNCERKIYYLKPSTYSTPNSFLDERKAFFVPSFLQKIIARIISFCRSIFQNNNTILASLDKWMERKEFISNFNSQMQENENAVSAKLKDVLETITRVISSYFQTAPTVETQTDSSKKDAFVNTEEDVSDTQEVVTEESKAETKNEEIVVPAETESASVASSASTDEIVEEKPLSDFYEEVIPLEDKKLAEYIIKTTEHVNFKLLTSRQTLSEAYNAISISPFKYLAYLVMNDASRSIFLQIMNYNSLPKIKVKEALQDRLSSKANIHRKLNYISDLRDNLNKTIKFEDFAENVGIHKAMLEYYFFSAHDQKAFSKMNKELGSYLEKHAKKIDEVANMDMSIKKHLQKRLMPFYSFITQYNFINAKRIKLKADLLDFVLQNHFHNIVQSTGLAEEQIKPFFDNKDWEGLSLFLRMGYLDGFAKEVNISKEVLKPFFENRDWHGLLNYLAEQK